MTDFNYKIDLLKQNLSTATLKKLRKDIDGLKLRNMERQYSEELMSIDTEIGFSTEVLKDLKRQISVLRHQISLVEICKMSEETKIQTHKADLNRRKRSFDEVYDKVRYVSELRKEEQKQHDEKEEELFRQKEIEGTQKIKQLAREANVFEKDCEIIERECAILKKRNNAIMLKMRRKLIETENVRKDLLKKTGALL